ncbi:MAG TPA: TraR/DksA family transcriptional regulator [Steroidobacteraceae bacterium]|nr:TraR/DksA family transcriptional regulator [Steroidobacteraceae bacterium]
MTHLDSATLEAQKHRLRERAAHLRDEIVDTLERSDDESYAQIAGQVRDREDASFADLVVDVNLSEVDRDVGELRAIDEALLRIKDGRYGVCDECGGEIRQARLEAEPTAIRCIRCQELWEQNQSQARPRPSTL